MIIHNMNTVFKYLCIPALITLPVASAYADDDTDSLTNKLISRTRANLSKGDLVKRRAVVGTNDELKSVVLCSRRHARVGNGDFSAA